MIEGVAVATAVFHDGSYALGHLPDEFSRDGFVCLAHAETYEEDGTKTADAEVLYIPIVSLKYVADTEQGRHMADLS